MHKNERDRSTQISFEASPEAKEIYKKLSKSINKGKWVSEAIIEKSQRENNTSISDQIKSAIEEHIKIYHRKDD